MMLGAWRVWELEQLHSQDLGGANDQYLDTSDKWVWQVLGPSICHTHLSLV